MPWVAQREYYRFDAPPGTEAATADEQGSNFLEGMMVIDLGQYRKAKKLQAAVTVRRYDEELRCVNWTPGAAMSAIFCYRQTSQISPHLPDDLASVDVDAFIDRIYGLASQI
jgi:hypothetical protein